MNRYNTNVKIIFVSSDKPPQERQKVDRLTSITIIGLLSIAIIVQLVTYQIDFEPKELDCKIELIFGKDEH